MVVFGLMLLLVISLLWIRTKDGIKKDALQKLDKITTYEKMNHMSIDEKPLRCKLGEHKFGLYGVNGIKTCELCGLRLIRGSYWGMAVPVKIKRDGSGV